MDFASLVIGLVVCHNQAGHDGVVIIGIGFVVVRRVEDHERLDNGTNLAERRERAFMEDPRAKVVEEVVAHRLEKAVESVLAGHEEEPEEVVLVRAELFEVATPGSRLKFTPPVSSIRDTEARTWETHELNNIPLRRIQPHHLTRHNCPEHTLTHSDPDGMALAQERAQIVRRGVPSSILVVETVAAAGADLELVEERAELGREGGDFGVEERLEGRVGEVLRESPRVSDLTPKERGKGRGNREAGSD
jgi:hypothetical protein